MEQAEALYLYHGDSIFERTPKGVAATLSGDRDGLSEELWAMLSYINGRLCVKKHRRLLSGSAAMESFGSVDNCLNLLEQAGYIAIADASEQAALVHDTSSSNITPSEVKPSAPESTVKASANQLLLQKCLTAITEVVERDLPDLTWELLLALESADTPSAMRKTIIQIANGHKKRFSTTSKRTIKAVVDSLANA